MMTIYVVMVEDRHADTDAHLFSTPEKAITYAQSVLDENSESAAYLDPDIARMSDERLARAGWLFYGCYSTEGDCVWVLTAEIDESDA